MQKSSKSQIVIQDIAGCGKFQIVIGLATYFFVNTTPAFTILFMVFGQYNPGWRCLQHNSTSLLNGTYSLDDNDTTTTTLRYRGSDSGNLSIHGNGLKNGTSFADYIFGAGRCPLFESCEHVDFNPESSTVISEWGLLCGRKWISSLIISLQMAGILMGSFLAGYLGDAIGRKATIYGALFLTNCFNLISIFTTTWQIFAVMRFFLGLSIASILSLYLVFTVEFIPIKWRSFLIGLPAYIVSTIFFSLTCMYLKNWRHVQIVTVAIGVVALLPAVWLPESLRWLEVKNKTKQFVSAANKVVTCNGKTLPSVDDLEKLAELETETDPPKTSSSSSNVIKRCNIIDLFKKELRQITLLLSVPFFVLSLVTYALEFGIKALHRNFYLNLIVWNVINIPFCIVPIVMPNLLGRKRSALVFAVGVGSSLLAASCMDRLAPDNTRGVGVAVLVFLGKLCIEGCWCAMVALAVELYPTVVRGVGTSCCLLMARVGGVIAPFLAPDDEHTVFISYTTMGLFILLTVLFVLRLPETRVVRRSS